MSFANDEICIFLKKSSHWSIKKLAVTSQCLCIFRLCFIFGFFLLLPSCRSPNLFAAGNYSSEIGCDVLCALCPFHTKICAEINKAYFLCQLSMVINTLAINFLQLIRLIFCFRRDKQRANTHSYTFLSKHVKIQTDTHTLQHCLSNAKQLLHHQCCILWGVCQMNGWLCLHQRQGISNICCNLINYCYWFL